MKTKMEWKLFFITDFEKVEAYLTDMHRKGWELVNIRFGMFYCFKEVEPVDITYKLDFMKLDKVERASYLQMYADYGWENVTHCRSFWIFRKETSQADDTEIFSDKASKLAMIERIYRARIILSLFLYVTLFILNESSFRLGFSVIYFPLMSYILYRFHQLRKSLKGD